MTYDGQRTRLRFVGAGLWGEDDPDLYPYDDAPMPRTPVVGDNLRLPDEAEWWIVTRVGFDYVNGLNYAPTVEVLLERPA